MTVELIKICKICGHNKKHPRKAGKCVDCVKHYCKEYYQNNKARLQSKHAEYRALNIERQRKDNKKRYEESYGWMNEIKRSTACADCKKFFHPVCLDWDHVRGNKTSAIATMVGTSVAKDKILEELKKCELVCANCHRVRTHITRRN